LVAAPHNVLFLFSNGLFTAVNKAK